MEKIYKYNENFPNIDKWLDEYHEECSEYIKTTSKTVNELVSCCLVGTALKCNLGSQSFRASR